MRSAKVLLLLGVLALSGFNLATTAMRSTIPLHIDGRVTRVEHRFEKNHGVDDVYLVWVNSTRMQVDTLVGRQVRVGDRIYKQRWHKHLRTPRGHVALAYSHDTAGMLPAMGIVALVGIVLSFGGKRL